MSGHTRLFRRGATYYHRAKIPVDIRETYPKSEETFSLRTNDYDEALKLLRVAAVQVDHKFDAHRRMLKGEAKTESSTPAPQLPAQQPKTATCAPLLSTARDEWFAMKESEGAWVPRTKDQYQTWTDRFLAIVGDRPITRYTKADGRKFKEIVFRLPANIDKRKETRGLSLCEVVEVAARLGIAPMSLTNANKAITAVSALWRWIGNSYDESPPNPLQGMVAKTKTTSRKERDPFTLDELEHIFKAPVFTGCESYAQWRTSGDYSMRDSYRFWVPLVALFSGMRMNEACQLYAEDIREKDGVHYFAIHQNRPDMKLKNLHSERIVPVHPELIALGLLDLINKRHTQGEARLFPDLVAAKDGYYSSNATKHFQRFFKATGVKHCKISFHSFRHSFEDACRDSNIAQEITDALQGHVQKGMAGRYGNGFSIEVLSEAMKRIRYRGLDLSHLSPATVILRRR